MPEYVIAMGLASYPVESEAEAEKKELDLISLRTSIKRGRHLRIHRYSQAQWEAKDLTSPLKIK